MNYETTYNDDKESIELAIDYLKIITINNISKKAEYKIGATFLGIRTNISGKSKLHIYIILFPFMNNSEIAPYINKYTNLYIKDVCLSVDESFYLWIYEEMRQQNSIVIMTLEDNSFKVVNGYGDLLISIDKNCCEKKDWLDLEFKDWYKNHIFNNKFTITVTNPYLYMVPFPVKPIILKTQRDHHNFLSL